MQILNRVLWIDARVGSGQAIGNPYLHQVAALKIVTATSPNLCAREGNWTEAVQFWQEARMEGSAEWILFMGSIANLPGNAWAENCKKHGFTTYDYIHQPIWAAGPL